MTRSLLSRMVTVPALGILAALPLTLTACGTNTVSAAEVVKATEDSLQQKVGTRPDVSCPHDLEAKVGATMRCSLTAGGDNKTYGVTVTVSSTSGDTAHFDIQVDNQPQS